MQTYLAAKRHTQISLGYPEPCQNHISSLVQAAINRARTLEALVLSCSGLELQL